VLSRLADDDLSKPNFARWHDLQVWLSSAEHRVAIPYAPELAELVPPVAVRLRRDFRAVLSLIRSHALLHQASRERDPAGRVIATFEDYATVRELVVEIVSESVEATVPSTVRELVEAVAASEEPLSIGQLAHLLNLDKSATSRRWQNARARGYLRNLEEKRGKPARIVLGDPLPDDVEILPSLERLKERSTVATRSGGMAAPPSFPGDDGYRDFLNRTHVNGHLTDREQLELRLHHALVLGTRTPAGDAEVVAEINQLIDEGLLIEPDGRR
jgi:hypothetical protein